MPPRISWNKLAPGLLALTAVLLAAVGVLLFAGVGRVRGEKVRFYVLSDQARGVMRGTEVWLAGQKVGLVDRVAFRGPTTDTSGRVVIAVSVKADVARQIRRDSRAQIRSGANIIGPAVVHLTLGSAGSLPMPPGDTVRARAQTDIEVATSKLGLASSEIKPIVSDAQRILGALRDTGNAIGAMIHAQQSGSGGEVLPLHMSVDRFRGPLGADARGDASFATVMERARSALARADSVRALLGSSSTSLGRFRRDASLSATVASIRDELGTVRARMDSPDGSWGRASKDSALSQSIREAQRNMGTLLDDIRRRPLQYVHFQLP